MADDTSRNEDDAAPEDAPEGDAPEADGSTSALAAGPGSAEVAALDADKGAASELGVERYVHAAFLATALLSAYLLGKLLGAGWGYLLDWPDVVRRYPLLLEYTEEQRGSITLLIGAVLGALLVLRYYRRPFVRNWATGVAGELSRVTWPSKDAVTNGTVVVLVAGAVATFYVAVLDRLWGYLTNLVYGT